MNGIKIKCSDAGSNSLVFSDMSFGTFQKVKVKGDYCLVVKTASREGCVCVGGCHDGK